MLLIVKANNMRIHVDYGRKAHHSAAFPHRDAIAPTRHGTRQSARRRTLARTQAARPNAKRYRTPRASSSPSSAA